MANKKGDENRSVRFTKQRIQEAMMFLLNERPVETITVRELAELANINRSTFYMYYIDIYDLLEKLEDQVIEELTAFFPEEIPQDIDSAVVEVIERILSFYYENHSRFIALLGPNGRKNAQRRVCNILVSRSIKVATQELPKDQLVNFEIGLRFLIEGAMGMFDYELTSGNPVPEKVAHKILIDSITSFLAPYKRM